MPTEQNKAIMRRFIEVFNTGKFDQMGKFVDAKVVDHNPFPGQSPGLEGLKQVRSLIRKAFPDLRVAIEDIMVEGDKVVARIVGHGTHKGEFIGVSPTGKKVLITAIYSTCRWRQDSGIVGGVQLPRIDATARGYSFAKTDREITTVAYLIYRIIAIGLRISLDSDDLAANH